MTEGSLSCVSSSPSITSLTTVNAQTIRAQPHPDWIVSADGQVWVTGVREGVAVYEPESGRLLASIPIPGETCGAPDVGFGSVWIPTSGEPAIYRVSSASRTLLARIPVELPAAGEFSIGVGEGGVWAAEGNPNVGCRLVRIDPTTNEVDASYDIAAGAGSVRAGLGGIWITCFEEDKLLRVDPKSGRTISTIGTERGPRFLAVGVGGIWVLNQTSASISRIDPANDTVVATIPVDRRSIRGGDISVGNGSIWVRASEELVVRIDPTTNAVVQRIGSPSTGSASAAECEGHLWISAGAEGLLYNIPIP